MHFVFSEILVRFSLLNTKHLFFIISLDFAVDNMLWFYRCSAHSIHPQHLIAREKATEAEKKFTFIAMQLKDKRIVSTQPRRRRRRWMPADGNVNDKRNTAITNRKMARLSQLFIHITYAQCLQKLSLTRAHIHMHTDYFGF